MNIEERVCTKHKQKQRKNENACRKCAKKSFVKTKKKGKMRKGR
jgi:hypothetical protein